MIRKHFRLKKIALGLAFAAVAVPTAQASPVSATSQGNQPIASEISVQSPVFVPSRHLPQADIQAINAPASSAPVQSSVSASRWQGMSRAYLNRPGTISANGVVSTSQAALSSTPVPAVQTVQAETFSWSDAGIGASVAFGASLLLLMAVVLGRRRSGSGPAGLASA
jgi:hypothetical protein